MFTEFEQLKAEVYSYTLKDSDISYHLPKLEKLAKECVSILELGVRNAHSTLAFLAGCHILYSVDINKSEPVDRLVAMRLPCQWKFIKGDSVNPKTFESPPYPYYVDAVFFDTLHTEAHLSKELKLYAHRAKKYLIFHDTLTCWDRDKTGPNKNDVGIGPAITQFRKENPQWDNEIYKSDESHGLLVLERSPPDEVCYIKAK